MENGPKRRPLCNLGVCLFLVIQNIICRRFYKCLNGFFTPAGQERIINPPYWYVYNADEKSKGYKEICCPVEIALYVRLTNDRDSSIFVDAFSVQTKTPDIVWVDMPIIDIYPDTYAKGFYWAPHGSPANILKSARHIDCRDDFV